MPTLSAALTNPASISNKITILAATMDTDDIDGNTNNNHQNGSMTSCDAYEELASEHLSHLLSCCPWRHLLSTYPSNLHHLSAFLRREFPALLSDRACHAKIAPSNVSTRAVNAIISVADVNVVKGKKKFKLSVALLANEAMGGQRATLECDETGCAQGAAEIFLGDEGSNKVKIEVWKNGEKVLGRTTLDLDECKNADGGERQELNLKVTLGNIKTGSIDLVVKVLNKDKETAVKAVGRGLDVEMISNLSALFPAYPKIVGALNGDSDQDAKKIHWCVVVEEEQLFDAGDKKKEFTAVLLNGKEVDRTEWQNVMDEDNGGRQKTYCIRVSSISGDVISVEKRKRSKASPMLLRKASTSSNNSNLQMGGGGGAADIVSALKDNLKETVANVLKLPKDDDGLSGSDREDDIGGHHLIFSEVIPVSEIPLDAGGKTVTHKAMQWRLKWKVECENENESDDEETKLKALIYVLAEGMLAKLTNDELLAWDGDFGAARQEVLTMARLVKYSSIEVARAKALIEVHSKHDFNDFVVQEAVMTLINKDEDLREVAGLVHYLRHVARKLSEYDAQQRADRVKENQIYYAATILKAVEKACGEEYFKDAFTRYFNCVLRDKLGQQFTSPDLEEIKNELQTKTLPTAERIKDVFAPMSVGGSTWHCLFCQAVLDQVVPIVHNIIEAKHHSQQPVQTFNLFTTLRKLTEYECAAKDSVDNFFFVFEPCLPEWADTVRDKARVQVEKVLEMERERHAGQTWEGFYEACVTEEWFENTTHVGGIFKSCEVTWKRLDWPKFRRNLEFGINLLKKLKEVLQYYIQSFFDIIYEDKEFDKVELVIILNSLSFSSAYLMEMFGSFPINEEERTDKVKALEEELSSLCQQVGKLASKHSDEFVQVFCHGEARVMELYVERENVFDEEDEDNCLLGRLNTLLRFLSENLRMSCKEETDKYNKMICKRLFESLDDMMVEHYDKVAQVVKINLSQDKAKKELAVIDEIIAFKKSLGLENTKGIKQLRESLRVNSMTTPELIAEHQEEVANAMDQEEDKEANSLGELVFHADMSEDHEITVVLNSLSGVKPRKDKRGCNPSVKVRLSPLKHRGMTSVYEQCSDVLFDLIEEDDGEKDNGREAEDSSDDDGDNDGEKCQSGHQFSFSVKENQVDFRALRLQFELYDHSYVKTHKVI